jgi:hypothetical protein
MPMNRFFLLPALLAALLALSGPAAAQQGRGCVNDRYGDPQCPPPGGRCLADIHGEIVCTGGCVAASAKACSVPVR